MHRTWCIFNARLAIFPLTQFSFPSTSSMRCLALWLWCVFVLAASPFLSVCFISLYFLFGVSKQLQYGHNREGRGSGEPQGSTCKWIRQCKVAAPAAPCAARVRVAMAVKKIQGKHGTCKMKLMNVQSKAIYSGASSIWDGNGWHTEGSNMGND